MRGTITTYLPEKGYGFIKGEDGKDYFFHQSEFSDKSQIAKLCEAAFISFDQQATPKGYQAKNCSLIDAPDVVTFNAPDEFITSKSNAIRGWEVMEVGDWIIHGTARDSPDAAKRDAIDNAMLIKANALLNLEYYKTTGSEGNYKFSVHHFRGRSAVLAKRHAQGNLRLEDLSGLNPRASILKTHLANKTTRSKTKRNIAWALVCLTLMAAYLMSPYFIILAVLVGAGFGQATDYDSWLEKNSSS